MPENLDLKLVACLLAAATAAFLGARALGGGSDDGGTPVRIGEPAAAAPRGGGRAPGVYVHVVGAVRRPGLYEVPARSRVADVLDRAGGPSAKADLAAVNLAARIQDGQQIVVARAGAAPAAGPVGPPTAGAAGAAPAPGATVSLSTATAEQLDAIDGIGPTLAQRIVAERARRGGFRSIGDLGSVDGIGDARLARLRRALAP